MDQILRALLINPNRLREWKYVLLLIGFFCLMIFVSIVEGRGVGVMGDFNVFWTAGYNFIYHNDLYSGIGGAQRYIYPPFAAMLFQLLALMPMNTAAGIYTFINCLLCLFTVYITRSIMRFYFTDEKKILIALLLSALLSFRFFLYHIVFVQMNELILVLSLLGVLMMLKKKETYAVICFVLATFIKIIPVFFIIWLIFRGNYKTYMKIIVVSFFCVLVPFIWRGFEMGRQDLTNYYITFLEPFKAGRVEAQFHNHSLSSAIYNISLPMPDSEGFDFNILHLTSEIAKKIYMYSFLFLFLMFIACLSYLRLKNKPINFQEVALILLTTHLLSGITWEYHLVSLFFVYMSLIMTGKKEQSLTDKISRIFLFILIVMNAIVGKDTVGIKLYHYFGGYGALTWMMVLLFFYFWYNLVFTNAIPEKNK